MRSTKCTVHCSLFLRNCHNASSGGGFNNKFPLTMSQFAMPEKKVVLEKLKVKIYGYMDGYEEFIGIKQVKEAHNNVIHSEMEFMKAQELRRTVQKNLNDIQNKLRDIRSDLDRTFRGEDRYLELIKQEIALVREERSVREKFEEFEKNERDCFNGLSNALRLSHEKEKAQNEKTKYWSVIGSVIGAVVGIIGTTINSKYKMRQMKQVMTESSTQSNSLIQSQLTEAVALLNEMSKSLNNNSTQNSTMRLTDEQGTSIPQQQTFLVSKDIEDFLDKSEKLIGCIDKLEQNLQTFNASPLPSNDTVPIAHTANSSLQNSNKNQSLSDSAFSTAMITGIALLFWYVFPADG